MSNFNDFLASLPLSPYSEDTFARLHHGEWTPTKLQDLLDRIGHPYRTDQHDERDEHVQFNFDGCPFCGKVTSNPAAWIKDGYPHFNCFYDKCSKTFADLTALAGEDEDDDDPIFCAADIPHEEPPGPLVEDLIRLGSTFTVIGGTKSQKTFFILMLLVCIAAGIPFLGMQVVQGAVLCIDNELPRVWIMFRLRLIAKALGLNWNDVAKNIFVWSLREQEKIVTLDHILARVKKHGRSYQCVTIDSLYMAVDEGTNLNDTTDMCYVVKKLDAIAKASKGAAGAVHHESKGGQNIEKQVTDVGAGSGALSRAVDAHIVIREHKDGAPLFVLDCAPRFFAPHHQVTIRFEYPIWKLTDVAPKVKAGNQKKTATIDEVWALLPDTFQRKTPTLAEVRATLGISEETVSLLVTEMERRGLVEIVEVKATGQPKDIRRTAAPTTP
ncbi:MAG: AAA family ATPase [Pirellulales bacterium]